MLHLLADDFSGRTTTTDFTGISVVVFHVASTMVSAAVPGALLRPLLHPWLQQSLRRDHGLPA